MRGATEVVAVPGGGVRGLVGGARIAVGTPALVAEAGADSAAATALAAALAADGATPMLVARDGALVGGLAVRDRVRDDAAAAVAALGRRGLAVAIVSGDRPEAVAAVAGAVGITDVVAGVDPPGKLARVRARPHTLMVGDGYNDAPALAAATVGIALGTGTDVAAAAADVTLMRPSLALVDELIGIGKAGVTAMRGNLAWAFAYNLVTLPLAAGLFTRWHLDVSPMLASVLMALSSVSVVTSSLIVAGRRR